jgi:hypothetical protein
MVLRSREGYQLLEAASARNLTVQWDNYDTLAALVNYLQAFRPSTEQYEVHKEAQDLPAVRTTSLQTPGYLFHAPSLECLRSLKSLNLLGSQYWKEDTVSRFSGFWLALAAANVQLERIQAPFASTFPHYVKSYHTTLKHLLLFPSPGDPDVATPEKTFFFEDYAMLSNHLTSLESLEVYHEQVPVKKTAWRCDPNGSWAVGGVDVAPLLLYSQLRRLCLPIAVRRSSLRDHAVIVSNHSTSSLCFNANLDVHLLRTALAD